MTTVVISQPFLFPWVGLFEQIRHADIYVHYLDVAFSKGSFVNRVQLKGPRGPEWLTVPLQRWHLGDRICDLNADAEQNWPADHFARLQRLYASAPYGAEMLGLARRLYSRSPTPLGRWLAAGIEELCRYLGIGSRCLFLRSEELGIGGRSSERVLALVQRLGGTRYVTGHGARHYLDHAALEAAGIQVEYLDYQRRPYPQLHGPFDPHVSILDLIANVGGCGREWITSPTVPWREFLARGESVQNAAPRESRHVVRPHFRLSAAGARQHSADGRGRESAAGHSAVD